MSETTTFYDQSGAAAVYLYQREFLYAFDGRPLGYVLRSGDIHTFGGKWVGWMQDGWVRDREGFCVYFQQDSVGGADKPRRGPRPEFSGREPTPAKGNRETPPERPARIAQWSEHSEKTLWADDGIF